MMTQVREAIPFIPSAALPPEAMISPRLEALATPLSEAIGQSARRAA